MEDDGSSQGCCSRRCPEGFGSELKRQLKLAWPLSVTQLTQFTFAMEAVIFCGHLGKQQLDAVALANSLINVAGLSIIIGLSTSCETLFSQIYGSTNKKLMGVVLLRSLTILLLATTPCMAVHLNAESLLNLLGQDPVIAKLTADYLLIFLPGLVSFTVYIVTSRYIQNQNIVYPTMISGIIANITNIILHYCLVYVAEMGITGSAISQAVSYILMCVLNVCYIFIAKVYKETWGGFDWEFLQEWGQFCKLAVAGLFMICIEWWSLEIGILLAGVKGATELGTMSIIMQFETVFYMVPRGVAFAASISVGQHLGAGQPKAAKMATTIAIMLGVIIATLFALVYGIFKDSIPYIFTEDQDVAEMTATVLPILAIILIPDGITNVCGGVMRGTGRQKIGAVIVAVGYVLALAIGIPTLFYTPLSVRGFWIGLAIAIILEAIAYFYVVYMQNWQEGVRQAKERAKEDQLSRRYSFVSEGKPADKEGKPADKEGKPDSEKETDTDNESLDVTKSDETTALLPKRIPARRRSQFTNAPLLSPSQLILRRGAVVLLSVSILALGIVCRFAFPSDPVDVDPVQNATVIYPTSSSWDASTTEMLAT